MKFNMCRLFVDILIVMLCVVGSLFSTGGSFDYLSFIFYVVSSLLSVSLLFSRSSKKKEIKEREK